MSGFPLYDNLYKNASNKDLTVKEKKNFISKVNKMNKNGKELLYALIKTYFLMNNDNKSNNKIPYGGKISDNNDKLCDIEWNLNKFPKNLKQMLNKFLHMNLNLE